MKLDMFQYVWDADAGVITLDNQQLRYVVAKSLSKLPIEIIDKVTENCLFIMPKIEELGIYLPNDFIKDKQIFAFPEKLLEKEEHEIEHTILHEVAHYYLKHKNALIHNLSAEEYDRQEEEANKQVDKWLRKSEL